MYNIYKFIPNNFYLVTSYRRVRKNKENDESLCTGSVTRYGPRESAASANVPSTRCEIFLQTRSCQMHCA